MIDINKFYAENNVKEYLDNLRESGETNMFGAGVYVENKYGIDKHSARALVQKWMKEFGDE